MSLSNGQLYDLAAERLGVGNYDPGTAELPYWKYRMNQIGMLARAMNGRKTHPDDLEYTINWCADRHLLVSHVRGLVQHVDDALRWRNSQAAKDDLEGAIAEAIARERSLEDGSPWLTKLIRAKGPGRQVVLEEWRAARG